MSDLRAQAAGTAAGAATGGAGGRTADAAGGPWAILRKLLGSEDLRKVLPGLMVSSLLSNMLALALPLAILQILDRVVKNQAMETLVFLAIGVVVALLLEEFLRAVNGIVTSWLGARFEHRASLAAMERLLNVPLRRYMREEPGAYAEKLHAAARVAEFYSGQALLVIFDLPFVLLFLGLIYFIGGELVLVPGFLLLIFTLLTVRYGRWMRDQVQARHVSDDRRFSFLSEVLAGIHSVKTMMMESSMERRYERLQEANAVQGEHLTHGSTLATGLGTLFSQVMIAGVIFSGAWVVIDGGMTPGSLAACMMLSVRSLAPLRRGLSVWLRYQGFTAADRRLNDLMALPVMHEEGKPALPPIEQGLELRDIDVHHDNSDAPIFSGLSLKIAKGECIAIRGESGSGKTTLMSLLSGLESADGGEVLVDGRPLADFSADTFHRRIALLPQSGTVVSGTILENLTMYDDALNDRALAVAKELGLDTIVSGMKFGYETRLGEDAGETMPLGVRQLITIIRALVHDPEVILFDEANIALDIDGDRVVRDFLERVKGERTLVLVTHRPSLVKLADHVYTLADGRLHESEPSRMGQAVEVGEVIERPADAGGAARIVAERFERVTDLSNCLLPLLDALDWHGRDRELAEALPHLERQLDLSGMFAVLANLGYPPRHVGLLDEHPDERLLPCLFLPKKGGAMVVLERLETGELRVFDGERGNERLVDRLPGSGDYYLFRRPEPVGTRGTSQSSWLGGLLWRFRAHLLLVLLVTLLSTVLALATPLFVMSTYDRVLPSGEILMGAQLLAGVGIAITLNWVLTVFKSRLLSYVAGRSEYILGVSVFQRIIGLPASSIEGLSVSRQVGRIRNLERLREFFLGPLALLAFDLPASLVMLAVLAIINPWILVVLMFSALAFTVLAIAVRQISERAVDSSSISSALRWEFVNETLNAMRVIRSVGAGATWLARLREMSGKSVMHTFREHQSHQRIGAIAQILGTGTGVAALIVSAVLVTHGEITGGVMIATMILTWRLTGPMQNVFLAATSVVRVKTNIRQIENLMKLPGERDSGVRQTIRPETRGGLALSRVSFRYANDADPALLGVTFNAPPKRTVAVTGPDGAGKSTLLKLMLRVYVPQAGTIRLDNVDIRQLTTTDLRSQVSYMPQSCEIFYGTVAQNLRLVHPAATDQEVRWAAEMAGLLEDVEELPQGFETRISNSRSDQLPHGFRQRLSLARTVLKPASVVLMDEPGTGMDRAGEEALVRCVNWLRGRATLVIVTLRPGHLRMADHVIYMEKGSVTAAGPFEKIEEKVMAGLR